MFGKLRDSTGLDRTASAGCKFLLAKFGVRRHAFVVAVALLTAFTGTAAEAESAAPPADSSGSPAASVRQENGKPQDRNCPKCGESVASGEACPKCGRILKGSTGGVDPTTGVQNRVKSDISNINRTNSNINRSLRNVDNNIRSMRQNIYRIRDINRRLR
jgi:ribosomal protein L32